MLSESALDLVQSEEEDREDDKGERRREREEERECAQEASESDESTAPASPERALVVDAGPPGQDHRDEREYECERDGDEGVLEPDLLLAVLEEGRPPEDSQGEHGQREGPDRLAVRHRQGGYCLT
jgi:hypothetical protein